MRTHEDRLWYPVWHAFIVNVKLSTGWNDLMGNPIWIPACISFNFLKKSSSANGTNVLFLWICHLSLTSLQEWKFYEWPLKFSLTAKGILIPWFNFKTFLAWQPWHTLILRISEIQIKIQIKMFFSNNRNENIEAITGVRHLQTADRRLQTADCMRQLDC